MYTVLVLLSLVYAVVPAHAPAQLGLINFTNMCKCMLGYTALYYNNYGCWCGPGGSGEPIDGIDACCMHHDQCYDAAVEIGACHSVVIGEYLNLYKWDCVNGEAKCLDTKDACKLSLCKCDAAVIKCWSKYPKPQNLIFGKPKCGQ